MVTRVKIFRNQNAIQDRRCAQKDTQEEGECSCPETFLANVVMHGNRHGQNEKKEGRFCEWVESKSGYTRDIRTSTARAGARNRKEKKRSRNVDRDQINIV